jgi:hypothetical protein
MPLFANSSFFGTCCIVGRRHLRRGQMTWLLHTWQVNMSRCMRQTMLVETEGFVHDRYHGVFPG